MPFLMDIVTDARPAGKRAKFTDRPVSALGPPSVAQSADNLIADAAADAPRIMDGPSDVGSGIDAARSGAPKSSARLEQTPRAGPVVEQLEAPKPRAEPQGEAALDAAPRQQTIIGADLADSAPMAFDWDLTAAPGQPQADTALKAQADLHRRGESPRQPTAPPGRSSGETSPLSETKAEIQEHYYHIPYGQAAKARSGPEQPAAATGAEQQIGTAEPGQIEEAPGREAASPGREHKEGVGEPQTGTRRRSKAAVDNVSGDRSPPVGDRPPPAGDKPPPFMDRPPPEKETAARIEKPVPAVRLPVPTRRPAPIASGRAGAAISAPEGSRGPDVRIGTIEVVSVSEAPVSRRPAAASASLGSMASRMYLRSL